MQPHKHDQNQNETRFPKHTRILLDGRLAPSHLPASSRRSVSQRLPSYKLTEVAEQAQVDRTVVHIPSSWLAPY